ncbi:NUDIX hydrolase [Candidatus Gracilibacteria bacterium]|nr:NUDIX hydrolase [Candidatus Gracilibacteria bacterium]
METSYEGIKECYYRVSAKACITNSEGKMLLCREDTGHWDIPGGGIDHGEEIHAALKREIMEEMGLLVTSISPQPLYVYISESSGIASPKRPICLLIYKVEVENLNFTPSSECEEIGFFSIEEALAVNLYHPNIKVMQTLLKDKRCS